MKKSLIALAALAATSAFAQSSVTMYGVVDVAYGTHKTTNLNGTVATKSAGVMDGSYAGSRIGFRGTEDLGGGLKANFLIEQGIAPTAADGFNKRTGSAFHQVDGGSSISAYTTGTNRQTFAGVSGGFGEVRVGYQYTNSYDLVAFNDLSRSEFVGGGFQNGTSGFVPGTSLSAHANGTRANAITYISPKIGALTIKAQLGQGTGRKEMSNNSAAGVNGAKEANNDYTSLMAVYAQGPVFLAAAYSKADLKTQAGDAPTTALASPYSGNAVTTANIYGALSAVTAPTNTGVRPQTAMTYGGSYDLGMAKLSFTMAKVEGAPATSTAESVTKSRQYSVRVPVGAYELVASTGGIKKNTGATINNDVAGTFYGVNYNMSKRTTAYIYAGTEKDKAVTTVSATAVNYKDTKTAVGIRHSF
jgi:predicted porin